MHQECSALKWSNLAIDRKPIYWVPHAVQTASLNLLGRVEEARTAAQLLKQVFPKITLTALPLEPIRPADLKRLFYQARSRAGIR